MNREDKFVLRWAKRFRAVMELGGKCSKCGKDDIFILDFHHKNPKEKDYGISQISAHIQWELLKIEISKCVLLCRNCHSKLHMEEIEKKFNENKDNIIEKAKKVDRISRPQLDENYIHSLLKNNTSLNKIAKILGKDVSTVYTIAAKLQNKHGEKLFLTKEEYNNEKRKIDMPLLIELYKNGKKPLQLVEHFKASKSTIYPIIRNLKRKKII